MLRPAFWGETMDQTTLVKLQETALRVREHIIRLSGRCGCFIGASLSCTDLIVYLYKQFLNLHAGNLNNPGRDYFLLSKGHDVPALYGTFVELGWIPAERLANHLQTNDCIYWHPNRGVPGIEFHSGSLGHLLAVASGIATDCKLKGSPNKIVVMVGDGELNEGSNWEALLVAAAHQMDNLLVIVDRNHFQANLATEDLIPIEPLEAKFTAFGAAVRRIDGHDFTAMQATYIQFPFAAGKPSVIIADTVRGKGLPSIEARADRWFVNFSEREITELLHELHQQGRANLTSETLTVR
jgi:transketolase